MSLRTTVFLLAFCSVSASAWGQAPSPGEAVMERQMDRLAGRLRAHPDLQSHVGPGFDRDSVGFTALAGLRKTDDTTVVAWFTGFGELLRFMDGPACAGMTKGKPTLESMTAIASKADSGTIARWLETWETSAVAFFLAPDRPEVDAEVMIAAVFALMADMPEESRGMLSGPEAKKKKPNPEEECRSMREFFTLAAAQKEPERSTFFRGLAEQLGEPEGSDE